MLAVRGLRVDYPGAPRALDGVDLDLDAAGALGILGASGSGKSTLALALLGLLPRSARIAGSVRHDGRELLTMSESQWRGVRGRELALVFQEPALALNPFLTAQNQVAEALRAHVALPRSESSTRARSLIETLFGTAAPTIARSYPHEMSGGERQRVGLALALACEPRILVADEATASLDAPLRAAVIEWIRATRKEAGLGLIWITHDPATLDGLVDRVLVLDAGRVVEVGDVDNVLNRPRHEATRRMLDATWPWPPAAIEGGQPASAP